jgi:hypothetical protein
MQEVASYNSDIRIEEGLKKINDGSTPPLELVRFRISD